jgi:hypothetical protein
VSDREKIGPRINSELWERFRTDVRERKGQTRGVLGDELENAIRQYLKDEPDPIQKDIDRRLRRIEDAVGITPADGGATPSDGEGHTHAPSRIDAAADEKPAANAATEKKVRWLAERVREETAQEFKEVPRSVLRDVVKSEYGFRSDTAQRYVSELIDHFALVDHPVADPLLVTEERRTEIIEQRKDDIREEAEAEL